MVYRVLLVVFFYFHWNGDSFQIDDFAYLVFNWVFGSLTGRMIGFLLLLLLFRVFSFFFCLFFSVFYGVWASVSVAVAWWWRRSTSVPRCSSIILTLIPLSFSAFYASGNNSDGLSWVKYKNSMLPWEFEKKTFEIETDAFFLQFDPSESVTRNYMV